jgi:hypothetical protein
MTVDLSQLVTADAKLATRLTTARTEATATLYSAIDDLTVRITGRVPLAEMLSWAPKEDAARAVLAGDTAQSALLEGEAAVTGEAVIDLATRIVRKADGYRIIIAGLTGLRRKGETAIAAAKSEEEIAMVIAEVVGEANRQARALGLAA